MPSLWEAWDLLPTRDTWVQTAEDDDAIWAKLSGPNEGGSKGRGPTTAPPVETDTGLQKQDKRLTKAAHCQHSAR